MHGVECEYLMDFRFPVCFFVPLWHPKVHCNCTTLPSVIERRISRRRNNMEHALFLDKPVRSNPRSRVQVLAVSVLPSPPCEITSPTPDTPSWSTNVHDSDGQLTSTIDKSTTEHMAIIASMTRPQWRMDADLVVNSASPDRTPQESSVTPGPPQQRRGKATKAACSTCRKRKSKV
jgi:hypothetical protein